MASAQIALTYWLAPHVRSCALDGQVVLLDLVRNRYLAVPEHPLLSERIGGWPMTNWPGRQRFASERVIRSLLDQRMLVDREVARPHQEQLPAANDFIDADHTDTRPLGSVGVARLAFAAVTAACALQVRNLDSIARDLASRKSSLQDEQRQDDMTRLATAYIRLRPLLLTSRDRCLVDSLTMLHFLRGWKLTPMWVIGVKTRPFAAHSWVQWDATVLNDHHDRVRRFRPILAI